MSINKHIELNYNKYKQLAIKIAKNHVEANDLLHTVLLRVLQSRSSQKVYESGNIDQYIYRSLYLSYHSKTSDFAYLYKRPDHANDSQLPDQSIEIDLITLINHENINIAIQRLTEIDRLIILLYKDTEFSYEHIHISTGIPISYLRNRITFILKYIRKHVYCSTRDTKQEVIYLPKM